MGDNHATITIPTRDEVAESDKWDLTKLAAGDEAWESDIVSLEAMLPRIDTFRGKLSSSAATLRSCFEFMNELESLAERLGYYAHLRFEEDSGDSERQARWAKFMNISSRAQTAASYQTPEIQSIPDDVMDRFRADSELEPFAIPLEKILRFKPHVLSEPEERLLAMQTEANQTASNAFAALTDVDMEFGTINTPDGPRPLSQSTYSTFLIRPEAEIRKEAFERFYSVFDGHKNTLATLYAGSVQLDKYRAEVRNFRSAKSAALFPDKVPADVYDNLVSTVSQNLSPIHEYYEVKRKAMGLSKLMHYDAYLPFVPDIKVSHTYEEAVDVVCESLAPLGTDYTQTLRAGLLGGWVDRYENKGKRSGAFSAGSYNGDPHILMNFKSDVLRDVFTLAHEGGHSMHSLYSAQSNPFQYYNYTIFEAEVASTFNEQLLTQHMMDRAKDEKMLAYLIGKQCDDIVATVYRQTMFAEYEDRTHSMLEAGTPLTLDSLRGTYRELLTKYFGDSVGLLEASDLEGLRIPHLYRYAFYVYKYSTGLSAAIALARRVTEGGTDETSAYLAFLKSGGSRYPLKSLALAGVDMSTSKPIADALETFAKLVERLKTLLGQ